MSAAIENDGIVFAEIFSRPTTGDAKKDVLQKMIVMADERNIHALNELLKKVIYSERIYERAAKSVHSEAFRRKLAKVAEERAEYRDKIKAEIIERSGSPESGNNLNLMIKELYMILSDIQVQKNVPDLLQMCLQADEDLLNQHSELIKQEHFLREEDPLAELIHGEYNHVKKLSGEFSKDLEAYPWR